MRPFQFGDNRHALAFGNQKINLHQLNDDIHPRAQTPLPGSADLCFVVNLPLDHIVLKLTELDIPIIDGPVKRTGAEGELVSVYIRDPDLNLIELSNPVGRHNLKD